jgi:hypothetical protein
LLNSPQTLPQLYHQDYSKDNQSYCQPLNGTHFAAICATIYREKFRKGHCDTIA